MTLSDKLKQEIIRRWQKCKDVDDKIKLAERYGYKPIYFERTVIKWIKIGKDVD